MPRNVGAPMSFISQEFLVSSVGMVLLFFSTLAYMYLVAHHVGHSDTSATTDTSDTNLIGSTLDGIGEFVLSSIAVAARHAIGDRKEQRIIVMIGFFEAFLLSYVLALPSPCKVSPAD